MIKSNFQEELESSLIRFNYEIENKLEDNKEIYNIKIDIKNKFQIKHLNIDFECLEEIIIYKIIIDNSLRKIQLEYDINPLILFDQRIMNNEIDRLLNNYSLENDYLYISPVKSKHRFRNFSQIDIFNENV